MTRRIDDRWFLPVEGLVSGLVTSLLLHLPYTFEFLGLAFGAVLAAHVWIFRGIRSPFRLIGFIATCVVAYLLSVSVPGVFLRISTSGTLESRVIFPAGVVGGAVVCVGVFFFLQPPKKVAKFLLKALCISAACGLLGVFGWSIGERLQGMPLQPSHMPSQLPNNLTFYSLFIVWQTGAASLLGLLLSKEQTFVAAPIAARPQPVSIRTKVGRRVWSIPAVAFFALILAAGAWLITPEIRRDLVAHRMRVVNEAAQRQLAAERPSSENLPSIVPLPVERVLLLAPIDGHPCIRCFEAFPRSHYLPYLAGYAQSATSPKGAPTFAGVEVRLYPNSAWAVYATKEFMWDWVAENPKAVTTVVKFGYKVVMNTLSRRPDGKGELYFYWPSGSRFVLVTFQGSEDDEFLKEYLAGYPSTL
jgi:hypothetical protein